MAITRNPAESIDGEHHLIEEEAPAEGAHPPKDEKGESKMEREREFEIGKDEAWFANVKRTYDIAQTHTENLNTVSLQALQNAVETANLVSKQSVRHSDVAMDRQWNVDEQGYTVNEILRNQTFKDSIAAAVAEAVAEIMNRTKK